MPPDANQQMGVISSGPIDRPVESWLERLDGNIVFREIIYALEMLYQSFQFVMSGNQRLGVDTIDVAERKQYRFLAQG